MKKKFLSFFCMAVLLLSLSTLNVFATAMADGAYTIGRQTSYVNPETGNTVDGGTNIALGDSMCEGIVEECLLVEQTNGKTYITIGIGLMSNIEKVRIQIRDQNGTYHDAKLTMTGSCQRNGDTCNHYRFEAYSADGYISPILYVTPMGRDVQFFVMPDISSAKSGTGNFVSEMIPKSPEATEPVPTSQPTESSQPPIPETEPPAASVSDTDESVNSETTSDTASTDDSTGSSASETDENYDQKAKKVNGNILGWTVGGIVVLAAGVCIWYFCFFKNKRN